MALRDRAIGLAIVSGLALAEPGWGQSPKLPIQRVVLFKNGVGFFEHVGQVQGNEAVSIGFTSGQLNDVLKSLTVLDLNGGRITGVAYGNAAPSERQLSDLRLPVGENTTLAEFLGALRGTKVEVKSGATVMTGRLLSVERKSRAQGAGTVEFDAVTVLGEKGELRTIEVSSASSIRLLEPGLSGKVDRFLDVLSTRRETDTRLMTISTAGTGQRSMYVSYISEVPIWKSTYRVVLNSKGASQPLLQGWAIVDNVVGEDWQNVNLSLVAGAPQSFIQNLSQPYYAQRPTIPLPGNVLTIPQTYQSTLIPGGAQLRGRVTDPSGAGIAGAEIRVTDEGGTAVGQTTAKSDGTYEVASVPEGSLRIEASAPGFQRSVMGGISSNGQSLQQDVQLSVGAMSESVQVQAAAPAIPAAKSVGSGRAMGLRRQDGPHTINRLEGSAGGEYSLNEARAAAQTTVQGQVLGDLFEYKIKEPITILKNRSALIPIVQGAITAEKVSVWNESAGLQRPQRALWLTNTTGATLDGGSVSVLNEDVFNGEGILEALQAGEKRLFSYASDLAVTPSARTGSDVQRVSRVRILRGTMTQESEIREKKTYTFRNEDSSARNMIVEHPVRAGYELRSAEKPVETTASYQRFRLKVEPKQTASLVIDEARVLQSSFTVTNLTTAQLVAFVTQRSIDHSIEAALRDVVQQKDAIAGLQAQKNAHEEESQKIFDDQQRVRENMKSLKGTPEEKALVQRYTQQLNEQENRLAVLQKSDSALEVQISAAQARLDATIEKLSFDVKL